MFGVAAQSCLPGRCSPGPQSSTGTNASADAALVPFAAAGIDGAARGEVDADGESAGAGDAVPDAVPDADDGDSGAGSAESLVHPASPSGPQIASSATVVATDLRDVRVDTDATPMS